MTRLFFEIPAGHIILVFSVIFLLLSTIISLRLGRIYGILLGLLSVYVLFTLASYGELASEFTNQTIELASFVVLVGTCSLLSSLLFFEYLFKRKAFNTRMHWIGNIRAGSKIHSRRTLVFGIISLVLFLGLRHDFDLTWSEERLEGGPLIVVATFLMLLSAPGMISSWFLRKYSQACFLLVINSACIIISGSRAAALTVVGFSAWLSFAFAKSGRDRIRLLCIIGTTAISLHLFLRFLRGISPLDLYNAVSNGTILDLLISSSSSLDISGGEFAISRYFVFAIDSSHSADYGVMTSAFRTILLYVPRIFKFIEKPVDITYSLWAEAYQAGMFSHQDGAAILSESFLSGNFGSVHPTMFGEFFASGQWLSLVASSFICGALCILIDRTLSRLAPAHALLLLGPVVVGMAFVARGNSVIGFGYFAYLYPLVLLSGLIFSRLSRLLGDNI